MKFRRSFVASKAPRQIRPAAAFSYLLPSALCPSVITFRGSLTPDNYSTVVVNFPRNKRRRPLRRWCRREAQYRVAAERRYQSYDFHSAQRPSRRAAVGKAVWNKEVCLCRGPSAQIPIQPRGWLFSGHPSRVEVSERREITCFYRRTVHPLLSQI